MKVVCIKEFEGKYSDTKEPADIIKPKVGEIYTVISVRDVRGYYHIKELDPNINYDCRKFRPIDDQFASDICAAIEEEMVEIEELIKETNKQLI